MLANEECDLLSFLPSISSDNRPYELPLLRREGGSEEHFDDTGVTRGDFLSVVATYGVSAP